MRAKCDLEHFQGTLKNSDLNKNIGFWGMRTLSGQFSEKLNFKFVINSKTNFSGGQKCKKMHFDFEFHILGSTS